MPYLIFEIGKLALQQVAEAREQQKWPFLPSINLHEKENRVCAHKPIPEYNRHLKNAND